MTDSELLEKAAKAAGLPWDQWVEDGCEIWNPLEDDGDALRLSSMCELDIIRFSSYVRVDVPGGDEFYEEYAGSDKLAATRRAIVRAAAAMAK